MIKVTAYKITDNTRHNTLRDSSIKGSQPITRTTWFFEKPGGLVVWMVESLYLTRGRLRNLPPTKSKLKSEGGRNRTFDNLLKRQMLYP